MSRNSESHNDVANGNVHKNAELKDTLPREARSGGLTNGLGSGRTNAAGNDHAGGSGMTNGLGGRTNGMTNGLGGKTNGTVEGGRTNGLTNGLNSTNDSADQPILNQRRKQSPSRRGFSIILSIILILTLIFSFIVLLPSPPPARFVEIDGTFSDWSSKIIYSDIAPAADASLDIENFSVATENEVIYGYLQTRGNLQSKNTIERYMIFVDSDKSKSTGYLVGDIGADYVIEAFGWYNSSWTVQASRFTGIDQRNWSAFEAIGRGAGRSSGNELEFAANIGKIILPGSYYARFATASETSLGELCEPRVDGENGSIVITQTSMDHSGIVRANNLLTLTLRATGKDVTINDIGFSNSGVPGTPTSALGAGMQVPEGKIATLIVSADMSNVGTGTFVKASVATVDSTGTSSVTGRGLNAYMHSAPANIAIDGAFADWDAIAKNQETGIPCPNPGIDITEHAALLQQNNLYVYVGFNSDGDAFGGMVSPIMRTLTRSDGAEGTPTETPAGTIAPASILPKITGEDMTCIYIDSQPNKGALIGGIYADYYIELKGIEGDIVSKRLFTYPGRVLISDVNVLAESGSHQLEASVPNNLIGSSNSNIYIYIETTDWAHVSDYTGVQSVAQPVVSGTRSGLLPVDLGTAGEFAVLAASAIPNTGTTTINGNLGLSPATGAGITGLPAGQVKGVMYAVDILGPAGSVMNPALLTAAKNDLTAAYIDARDRVPVPTGVFLDPGFGDIGGMTLVPGLYKFTSTAGITGTSVTLSGGSADVWIFQIGTSLTMGSGIQVLLAGGAQASNIFWQVGSSATIGTYSDFKGTIMADQSITVNTGATFEGRALAMVAAVTLDTNNIAISQSTVVINEVMFDNATNPDWFELHNPSAGAYNISGWKLIDGTDLAVYTYPATTSLGAGGYSKVDIGSSLGSDDYLALVNANGTLMDFVAWGTSQPSGTYYQLAVDSFNWPTGLYVDTTGFVQGNTIGRDANSTDTNSVSDWDVTCGVDATFPTPEAQNLDIPEFHEIAVPLSFLLIIPILAISRRRRMSP